MAMSATERFYRRLLRQLRQRYGEVVGDIVFREKTGAPAWVDFRNGLEEVFRWASIVQSGKIRYRALGEKIELPGPVDEIELGELMDANPWLRGQSEVLFPIIAQQTDAVIDAEKTFVQEKAEAIRRNPKSLPLYRLEMVYRNTLATVVAASDQAQMADPDVGNVFPFGEYNTREDARVRDTHRAMDGFVALRTGEGLDILRHVLPPAGYNCFLPQTRVAGRFLNGQKLWYDGPAVHIKTRRGHEFYVTAQHPVVTTRGLVPAGELTESMDLIGYRGNFYELATNDHQRPARIDDVFETFRLHGISRTGESFKSLLDFYGDARFGNGQVDIVWPDGFLLDDFTPDSSQCFEQSDLVGTDTLGQRTLRRFGRKTSFFNAPLASSNSLVSRRHLRHHSLAALALYLPPLESLGIGLADDWNPSLLEPVNERHSGDAKLLRQLVGGFPATGILGDDSVGLGYDYGMGADWDVVFPKELPHGAMGYSVFARQLFDRSAGQVGLDNAISVSKFRYRGHVYDLQSSTGSILANGVLQSNCRCFMIWHPWFKAVRKGWAKAKGDPKWEFKWPSRKARMNYESGAFPEWVEPRFVAPLE